MLGWLGRWTLVCIYTTMLMIAAHCVPTYMMPVICR